MSQGLRQRSISGTSSTMTTDANNNDEINDVTLGAGLSAPSMLEASPSHHGVVLKLHIPLIFGVLPTALKNLVVSWNCLSWFMPQWHQRYLILIGNFLYKFKNNGAATPKGTPISVDSIDANLLLATQDDEMSPTFANLPPGFDTILTVSNFGKKHYYAVSSREEALSWVNSLRQNRQEAITRSMGHAGNMPYPKAWAYFDCLGESLQKSKKRIQEKVEQHNMREMELSSIGGGGGASTGAFYG